MSMRKIVEITHDYLHDLIRLSVDEPHAPSASNDRGVRYRRGATRHRGTSTGDLGTGRTRTMARLASGCVPALLIAGCTSPFDTVAASGDDGAAPGGTVLGAVRVIDGDTLEGDAARYRLHGIDAPERDQRCGDGPGSDCAAAATARLRELVAGGVTCRSTQDEPDRYGRVIAKCFGQGTDVGGQLVREGLAWAYVRYSNDYAADEDAARAERRGVWATDAIPPWEWRDERQ